MILWEQYNTLEDGDTRRMSRLLLDGIELDDPRLGQYRKEHDIQKYARLIQYRLTSLDFDNEQFRATVKDPPAIDLDYCKSRYAEDTSILLKWHYCIVLFFAERGSWVKKAIPLILQSIDKTSDKGDAVFYLILAFNLNKIYSCGLEGDIKETALSFVDEQNNPHLHSCVRIISALEKSKEVRSRVQDIAVAQAEKQADPIVAEADWKSAIEIAQDKEKNHIRVKLARHCEQYGDKCDEALDKIIYYKKSQDYFQDMEDKERIGNKIHDASKDATLTKIEHTMENSKFPIPGENSFERLGFLIGLFKRFIPNVEQIEQQTKNNTQEFPLASLFRRIRIDDAGIPTSYSNSAEQINRADYVSSFEFYINHFASRFSISVEDYEKNGKITIEDHLTYLKNFGLHGKSVLLLIEHGIKMHYDGNYVSSIHILLPQIEYTLRKLLEVKGISTLALKHPIMQYKTLHSLICQGSPVLGSDFTEFLKLKLVNYASINLRNKICHSIYEERENLQGYTPLHSFTHATSLSLILIIALLTSLSI